ncbi:hypothetical protein ACFFLM_08015 [Deinococcus oregonensis]|uniref:Tetratricopeptide repeat protein n=1 Tax=Deinococcus oregonensis TaxID=1805970 RepID=A0ABV6AYX2_9DEIO
MSSRTLFNLPTFVRRPRELILNYRHGHDDYDDYMAKMRQVENGAPLRLRLEAVLNLAVEGDFRQALDLATRALAEVDLLPRVVLLRLIGGLHYDLGGTRAAQAAYRQALDLLQQSGRRDPGTQRLWSATADDLLSTEDTLALPPTNGPADLSPFDRYARHSGDEFTRETFKAEIRPSHVRYLRTGFPDELAAFNAAVAAAYACGDAGRARLARQLFGQRMVLVGLQQDDARILTHGLQELLRSGRVDQLRDLLRRSHELLVSGLNVSSLLRDYRPAEEDGRAAEPYWWNLFDLIHGLEVYADDDTRRSLTELLYGRIMRDSAPPVQERGPQRPAVPTREFVQAFNAAARPSLQELDLLFGRVGTFKPNRHNDWWQLFTQREWKASEEGIALKVVGFALTLNQPDQLPTAAELLGPILARFSSFDAQVVQWATQHQEVFGFQTLWWIFLNRRVEGVAPLMPGWIEALTLQLEKRYRGAATGSVELGGPLLESFLAPAMRCYPQTLSGPLMADVLRRLLETMWPPDLLDFIKSRAYGNFAEVARLLADAGGVRRLLEERNAALEEAQPSRLSGSSIEDVRLTFLRLKQVLGCPLLREEWALLLKSLGATQDEQRLRQAVEVSSEVFRRQEHLPELRALLTVNLEHQSPFVRGAAVAAALYGGELEQDEVTPLSQRLLERARQDHPYVVQTFLAQIAFQEGTRRGPYRETILAVARHHQYSVHAGVRERAHKLVDLLEVESHEEIGS